MTVIGCPPCGMNACIIRRVWRWGMAGSGIGRFERRRALIWKGVPAAALPDGAAQAAVMLQVAKDSQPKRRTVLQDALDGDVSVYHPIHQQAEDEL